MKMVNGQLGKAITPEVKTWNTMLSFCIIGRDDDGQEKEKKEQRQTAQRILGLMEQLGVQGDDITEERKRVLLLQARQG